MPVTALAHHKGGVGTTTMAMLLAAELAARGRRVLAVDLDPQGNLTRRMGYAEHEIERRPSMAEVIQSASPAVLRTALLPCQWAPDWAENITLAPARIELENRVPEAGVPGSWLRLRRALEDAASAYEDVLIDTPPTLGHFLHLALTAAEYAIAPTTPTYDALRGVTRLQAFINSAAQREALGMRTRLIGVVINGKRTTAVHNDRTARTIERWGDLVWRPYITLRGDVDAANEHAEPPQMSSGAAGPMIRMAAKDLTDRYLKEIGH